jgi:hypothetical protein
MALDNWTKSVNGGKWYHKESGDTIEIWQRGNNTWLVYLSFHGSTRDRDKTLGTFHSQDKANRFIKQYMKSH